MKRIGTWIVYVVGGISIGYLALFAYNICTKPELTPGEPIKIFRKEDAPNYS